MEREYQVLSNSLSWLPGLKTEPIDMKLDMSTA